MEVVDNLHVMDTEDAGPLSTHVDDKQSGKSTNMFVRDHNFSVIFSSSTNDISSTSISLLQPVSTYHYQITNIILEKQSDT